jgi:uncharacterized membrane protein
MAEDLSKLTTDVLHGKLKAAQSIQRTVFGIFAVIILAWIVLGFWRTNTPVFISTIAVAVAAGASVTAAPRGIRAELARRESAA